VKLADLFSANFVSPRSICFFPLREQSAISKIESLRAKAVFC
jgi:hypothetical protein